MRARSETSLGLSVTDAPPLVADDALPVEPSARYSEPTPPAGGAALLPSILIAKSMERPELLVRDADGDGDDGGGEIDGAGGRGEDEGSIGVERDGGGAAPDGGSAGVRASEAVTRPAVPRKAAKAASLRRCRSRCRGAATGSSESPESGGAGGRLAMAKWQWQPQTAPAATVRRGGHYEFWRSLAAVECVPTRFTFVRLASRRPLRVQNLRRPSRR